MIDESKFNENEIKTFHRPNRPIIKEAKPTTKVRVVFNASSKHKKAKS